MEDKEYKNMFLGLIRIMVEVPVVILSSLYAAWIFTYLWKWFVVPLGVSQIGVLHAFGFIIIVRLLTVSMMIRIDEKQQEEKDNIDLLSKTLVRCMKLIAAYSVSWLLCYVAYRFMV